MSLSKEYLPCRANPQILLRSLVMAVFSRRPER